ncbi:MAG: hypothetical protein IJG40_12330 [Oscillospiraceae bacterium]|nr:hypothetical protein [Oscillospiraceae bacterium]
MKILALLAKFLFSAKKSKIQKKRAKRIRARKRKAVFFGLTVLCVALASASFSVKALKHRKERNTHLFYGSRY